MWWNDIKDVKDEIDMQRKWRQLLADSMISLNRSVEKILDHVQDASPSCMKCENSRAIENGLENVKEVIYDLFRSEDENNSINRIHDKLDTLLSDATRAGEVLVAEKTLDKFEDYMKNIDKLNLMANEFKGCVAMARGAIEEGKIFSKELNEMRKIANISQEIHKSMLAFIQAGQNIEQVKFFKIDAIYDAICGNQEKKSRKPRKTAKKKKDKVSA